MYELSTSEQRGIAYRSCCLARLGRVRLGLRSSLLLGCSGSGFLGGGALGGRLLSLLVCLFGLDALLGGGGLLGGSSLGSSLLVSSQQSHHNMT